jgi:hypothetical protein
MTDNSVIPIASIERLNRLGIGYRLEKLSDDTWHVYSPDIIQSDWYGKSARNTWEAFIIHIRKNLLREGRITLAEWPKIWE